MVEEQYREGQVNPARIISRFEAGEEQNLAASLFHTKLSLESDMEKQTALKDVICNMKESSLNYRLSHLSPEDLAGLQESDDRKEKAGRIQGGAPARGSFPRIKVYTAAPKDKIHIDNERMDILWRWTKRSSWKN